MYISLTKKGKHAKISIDNIATILLFPMTQTEIIGTPIPQRANGDSSKDNNGYEYEVKYGKYLGFCAEIQLSDRLKNILDDEKKSEGEKGREINKLSFDKRTKWYINQKTKQNRTHYLIYTKSSNIICFTYTYYKNHALKIPNIIEIPTPLRCQKRNKHKILNAISDRMERIFDKIESDFMIKLKNYHPIAI